METLNLINTPYIQDIEEGLLEEGYFLLKKINLEMSKNNKTYLRMLLSDKTGHMPSIYFDTKKKCEEIQASIVAGNIVKVKGILEEYNEVMQVRILNIEGISEDKKNSIDLTRFSKRTPKDRRNLFKKIKNLIHKIKNKELLNLCLSFFKDKTFLKLFLEAPASRYVHHSYIGGLLEHTLNVMELVMAYSKIFKNIDLDLIIAGAFLHDLGKVDEYIYLYNIKHSTPAKLKGHTLLGYDRLQEKLVQHPIEANLQLKLEHIILSHQGKRVWGAIEEPKFLEAYLIHAADSTDSSQFIFQEAKKISKKSKTQTSDFISYHHRDIYLH